METNAYINFTAAREMQRFHQKLTDTLEYLDKSRKVGVIDDEIGALEKELTDTRLGMQLLKQASSKALAAVTDSAAKLKRMTKDYNLLVAVFYDGVMAPLEELDKDNRGGDSKKTYFRDMVFNVLTKDIKYKKGIFVSGGIVYRGSKNVKIITFRDSVLRTNEDVFDHGMDFTLPVVAYFYSNSNFKPLVVENPDITFSGEYGWPELKDKEAATKAKIQLVKKTEKVT